MYLPDIIQQTLRDLEKINENEVVQKQGDMYVAINVLTAQRRILSGEFQLIESLTNDKNNKQKKILKG